MEVAVIVAVPVVDGVKIPALLILPIPDGLADHVTVLLKLPVPVTVGVQVEVWLVCTDDGEHVTETPVIVDAAVTVTVADPDLLESCVEVAVTVAVPVADGVKMPAALTLPMLDGVTDQVTELL